MTVASECAQLWAFLFLTLPAHSFFVLVSVSLCSLQWKTATTMNLEVRSILQSPRWTQLKEVDALVSPGKHFSSEQCHSLDKSWRTSSRVFPLSISL